jgi:hypothetical protein
MGRKPKLYALHSYTYTLQLYYRRTRYTRTQYGTSYTLQLHTTKVLYALLCMTYALS